METATGVKAVWSESLRAMGLMPEIDSDGDLKFKYNFKTFFVVFEDRDPNYVAIFLPNIFKFEESDSPKIYRACSDANRKSKVAKVYSTTNNVQVTIELYTNSSVPLGEDSMKLYLDAALNAGLNFYEFFKTEAPNGK